MKRFNNVNPFRNDGSETNDDRLCSLTGTLGGSSRRPWKSLIRHKVWMTKGKEKGEWNAGCDFAISKLRILWININRKSRESSFCILFIGTGISRCLFGWDAATVGVLGDKIKWLRPLQSFLWFSFTKYMNGDSSDSFQCQN